MKSSTRFWLTATAVVALSLAPKIILGWLRDATPAPPTRTEALRRFLAEVSGGPVSPITEGKSAKVIVGWRFEAGRCAASAFPSSPSGTFDLLARNEARAEAGSQMDYVYRGAVGRNPPTWTLAFDIIAFRAISAFSPSKIDPPGYTVLVLPAGCAEARTLPWSRFKSD